MNNGLVWSKLVVTEVTASPISVFSLGPSFSLALELKRYSAGIWCSTCSLTEIYFREEDDFLDWLPLLPVLFVTMIQEWTLQRFNLEKLTHDNQTHRRVMYSKRQYIYINSFDWLVLPGICPLSW